MLQLAKDEQHKTKQYILCHGWEVDTGFIQPEVEGRGSDSPRAITPET